MADKMVTIPKEFWQGMTVEEFGDIVRGGGFNADQSRFVDYLLVSSKDGNIVPSRFDKPAKPDEKGT